ncbi:hypothetical protein [Methanoregula sp.]|uniref:hypothetical protein n=1 Tax=Methanoregula sp. TaxID=2052170 RepID=UPI002372143A|nr:hypothetical protein [Methanoregula sp.]MDD1686933.1 hypothetical protein [Methanoregula sp.]
MLLELLDLIIGIAFGFFHKGQEDYRGLLKNSAIIGIVASIAFTLVSMFLLPATVSTVAGLFGVFSIIVMIILYVLIFIVGAFIGDKLETLLKK